MKINKLKKKVLSGEVILLILFLIITPIVLTPWIQSNDGAGYYSYVRSFVIDHDLDLENEKNYFEQDGLIASIKKDDNTGKYFSQYPIGTSLLWLPYFLVGHLVALLSNFSSDGYSFPYILAISIGSAINAFIAILLIFKLIKKHFEKKVALLSVITIWTASNLFYYMYLEPSMSHANSLLSITLFLFVWHKTYGNRTLKQWALIGMLAGLATLVRYQNIIFIVLPFIEILPQYLQKKVVWLDLKKHVLFLIFLFLFILPQLMLLLFQHGSIIINYDGGFAVRNIFLNFFNVLFSNHHGLFNWTPILLFAVIGLITPLKKVKKLSLYFLLVLTLNLLIVSGWTIWYGGQSYGHRMFINMMPIFAFGLAIIIEKLMKKINFYYIIAFCCLFATWNFGLMIQYGSRMIDSQAAVPFMKIFYNNFINVPKKLIEIIKTFIFNRGKFLK